MGPSVELLRMLYYVVSALGDLHENGKISMSNFVLIVCPLTKNNVNRYKNCFKDIHDLISASAQFDSNKDGAKSQHELSARMTNIRMGFINEDKNTILLWPILNKMAA